MATHDIHALDKQGFIPSIFNWCDRRCERCHFIRQCRVGAMEADDVDEDGEVADERPEDFRARMEKLMGMPEDDDEEGDEEEESGDEKKFDTRAFMEETQKALDEEDEDDMADFRAERERIHNAAEAHPAAQLANAYMDLVDEWIGPREESLKAKGAALHPRAELSIDPVLRDPNARVLTEALDTVLWFQRMLWVKTMRALQGKIEDPEWMKDMDMDPLQGDWNGTAKLCLRIVEESQGAWGTIAELLPEEADSLQAMTEALRRCDEELQKEFPDARKFIRPGFDEHMGSPDL